MGPWSPAPLATAARPRDRGQQVREALGYRLRDIRKDARLPGRQLAAITGWHFTKISKIEHGRAAPSEADIELWCFHCNADRQIPELKVFDQYAKRSVYGAQAHALIGKVAADMAGV